MKRIIKTSLLLSTFALMVACGNEETSEITTDVTEAIDTTHKEVILEAENIEAEISATQKELEEKENELNEALNNL